VTDARRTPRNDRVAAHHLDPELIGDRTPVSGQAARVAVSVADLLRTPNGPRDRQLLAGDQITVLEDRNGLSFVQAEKDGYVGYLPSHELAPPLVATHRISARSSHAYDAPDFKSGDRISLSAGSLVCVERNEGKFAETEHGYIPLQHLSPLQDRPDDPLSVAEMLTGTPYLWGGNSAWGIDCSGLVQIACHACGIACPGDSDQQQAELGIELAPDTQPERGDLLFWKGHVAWVSEPGRLLHANVHHMAVAYEPLNAAVTRIMEQGDGPVLAHKRLQR